MKKKLKEIEISWHEGSEFMKLSLDEQDEIVDERNAEWYQQREKEAKEKLKEFDRNPDKFYVYDD